MNVSILKNPASAASQRRSMGRVHFALPLDLRPLLLDFISGSDTKPYEQLVITLSESTGSEEQKIMLLHNCCGVVGLLDQRTTRLVATLLSMEWVSGGAELVQAYQQFVVELLAAHNYYTKTALEKLLGVFKPVSGSAIFGDVWPDLEPPAEDLLKFTRAHEVIARILRVIPMAGELLVQLATHWFPFFRRPALEQQSVVYNMLRVCEYQPELRPDLLSLVISRMVSLDVQIPRELLEEELDDDAEMDVEDSTSIFTMDDVAAQPPTQSMREMRLPMAQTLDILMEQLLGFVQRHCSKDEGPSSWQHHRELYRELCVIFERQLLLTHGSHHVQFVMFFLCSLRPPTLVEHFIGSLWSRVTQPGETAVARQSAVCYLASLLARARYASAQLVRSLLAQMAGWCHAYVGAQQDSTSCDVRQHPVFYTVCQALFYVVAFRHSDLVNTDKGLLWTQSLGLGRLVTCRLNPLKPCLPAVAQNFAAVTRTYQLAYCYTVMERNSRACLPCVNQHSGQPLSTRLTTFFPFDPYLLSRSAKFISSQYRQYEALEQPASEAGSALAGASDGEEEEEEEESDGLSPSDPSVSSASLKQLISPDMFSYGTSPGFKHM